MNLILNGLLWVAVYLILVLSPLFVLLISPTPPGRDLWREISVALGFAGLAMMGTQFLLTARFRRVTFPFGIDIVYHFHRQISITAFILILAHPVILFISAPQTLVLLDPLIAPWRAKAGIISVLAFLGILVSSLRRVSLGIRYETWRLLHGILAITGVALALSHIVGVGHYMNVPWKRILWIGFGTAWIGALLYVRLIKPYLMLRRPYRVKKVIPERGRTWTLVLESERNEVMRFMPGQFAWLTILSSPYAIREHPFSFSSSAMNTRELSFTIKALGDFTSRIRDVVPGTRAYLDGPYGAFSVDRYVRPGYVFVAGGVGITPIMSTLRTLADRHDARPLLLIYANKTWDGVIFREELDSLQERLDLRVIHVLEQSPPGWEGETGFVTPEILARYLPESHTDCGYFLCGPAPMMDAVEKGLSTLGTPLDRIHAERFNLI